MRIFDEGFGSPEEYLVAGAVLNKTNLLDLVKCSVIEHTCYKKICSLADLFPVGFDFT